MDLVVVWNSEISWYDNLGGGGDVTRKPVASAEVNDVALADMDGDGDLDVVASETFGDAVWFENLDGKGGSFQKNTVGGSAYPFLTEILAVDIDGDGDQDVVLGTSGGLGGGNITWFANDGDGNFGDAMDIVPGAESIKRLIAADLDNDGDQDVVAAFTSDFPFGMFTWYENDGGNFQSHLIKLDDVTIQSVSTFDPDNDGDLDLITASGDGVLWYANTDGKGEFGPPQRLLTEWAGSIETGDYDNDGDVDFVAGLSDKVVLYSQNGGSFFAEDSFNDIAVANSVLLVDIDQDADLDVVTSSFPGELDWFENRLAGDADNDGLVGFSDFLIISANFGLTDQGWEGGDLDGDGRVGFGDFLLISGNFGAQRFR